MKKGKEIIGFGICVLLGAIGGILAVFLKENGIVKPISSVWIIIAFVISMFLQIIIHELGHLIAGLFSGYEFNSFRITNLIWIKENGRVKLKKYSLKGTMGQCLMVPPENKANYPVILYNLGGVLMNIIVSIVALLIAILLKNAPLMIFAGIGFFFAFLNGIPMKSGGVPNDGMNVKCFKKDPLARQAFDSQLRFNALSVKGARLKDMPDEWFEIPVESDLNNINTGTLLYMQAAKLLDACEFDKAKEKIQWILDNVKGLIGLYINELKCELIFCNVMLDEYEEAEKLYEYEMKKYINETGTNPSRKRLMYGYYLLVEKDSKKAEKELALFGKLKKTYPNKGDLACEEEFIDKIKMKKV